MKITKPNLSGLRIVALTTLFLFGSIAQLTILKSEPIEYIVQGRYEQRIPEHKYFVYAESVSKNKQIQVTKREYTGLKPGDIIIHNEVNSNSLLLTLLIFFSGLIGWELIMSYLTKKSYTI